MNFNEYQDKALRTCSPSFYGTGVDPAQLALVLSEASLHCEKLDAYKRALFYGDDKYALNQSADMDLLPDDEIDILHAVLGIVTEAGELAEGYVTTGDRVNLKEEGGDLMWYLAALCRGLGTTMEEMATTNVNKLTARYPEKYTNEKAVNRDLDVERSILEE